MSRAYLIAEAGVNHSGDLDTALEMVRVAKDAGCDAIKFQVYDPGKLATADAGAYWDTALEPTLKQRDLFNAHFGISRDGYEELSMAAYLLNLDFIVSVFHPEDVGWLAPLVSYFKIASGDITNRPLLEAVAATRQRVILSTGASTIDEIVAADNLISACSIRPILLHCTLSYPQSPKDTNLSAIPDLQRGFPLNRIGYSDHTMPEFSPGVCFGAYMAGARVSGERSLPLARRPGDARA